MSNTFFLRDGYTPDEMRDRVHSSRINTGNSDFVSVLWRFDLEPDEFRNVNKEDFFLRIQSELGDEFDDFVEALFEQCGQEGDTFNLQLFSLPEEASYDSLYDRIETIDGSRLDEIVDVVDEEILVDTIEYSENWIDFGLKTAQKVKDIEPDEDLKVTIERIDTGEVEAEYGPEYIVKAPTQDLIEARVYPADQLVAVSNGSGIKDGVQNQIVEAITVLGASDV
jgi:hypothetical protein